MRTGFFLLLSLVGLAPLAGYAQGITRLTPPIPDGGEMFGAAVALTEADDGTWALVGDPGDNDATGDAGSVSVYHRTEAGWELQAQLFAPGDPLFRGGFGNAIALRGRLLLVGETGYDALGQAYVFRREGEGMDSEWTVEAVLVPEALAHPEHVFGVDVALDTSVEVEAEGGFVAVVGAATRGLLDPVSGAAHVFRRAGEGEWVEEAVVRAGDEEDEADQFGWSIAADAGRIAVGAYLDERSGGVNMEGAVYVFSYDAGTWGEEDRIQPSTASFFGVDVDLKGQWLVAGATGEDCPIPDFFTQCGATYIYKRDTSRWRQRERIQPDDLTDYDLLGAAVTLSLPYALVTAPLWDTEGPNNAGAAYLYRLNGSTWRFERLIRVPDPIRLDQLGRSAALSETTALLGSYRGFGSAYAFDLAILLPNESQGPQVEKLTASVYPNPSDGSVTLSFQLSQSAEVHVEVFDTLGRVVWSRAVRVGAGSHAMEPEIVGTGLHFIRLRASTGATATTKLLRLGR